MYVYKFKIIKYFYNGFFFKNCVFLMVEKMRDFEMNFKVFMLYYQIYFWLD